jgi:hypothetical protein
MTPDEVLEIITLLREAADCLADVRADLGELVVMPSSVATNNGKCKLRIVKGVTSAEIALREALEPMDF